MSIPAPVETTEVSNDDRKGTTVTVTVTAVDHTSITVSRTEPVQRYYSRDIRARIMRGGPPVTGEEHTDAVVLARDVARAEAYQMYDALRASDGDS